MKKKLAFAIVGCGHIGNRHAVHIQNIGQLAAVCDTDKIAANLLANQYATTAFYSLDEMLKNSKHIDVVAICTPNGLHAQHTLAALQHGCHVLCEKPMATSLAHCKLMIDTANATNKKLFIVKQNRFNPPVLAVKQLINEGKLGKLFSIQLTCFWNRGPQYYKSPWKGTLHLDGGTLFTQFSHFIDLLYWLVGDVEKVQTITQNFNHQGTIAFEDAGVVLLQFCNGAIGTINYTVNAFEKNMEGSLTIIAEKGTVKIGGEYLNELTYQNIQNHQIANLPKGNPANQYGGYAGSMSNHNSVYENVVDVLTNNAAMYANATDGMKTVEIIEKIYAATKASK